MEYPLPEFDFHEAAFVGILLMGSLEGLNFPEPLPRDAEVSYETPTFNKMLSSIDEGFKSLLPLLDEAETPGVKSRCDKQKLKGKLQRLNETQRVRLFVAVKRLFWSDPNLSQAEALYEAGFYGKNSLQLARLQENYDIRRKRWGF